MSRFQHGEAYCVMKYDYSQTPSKFGPPGEEIHAPDPVWFWNSRDGVTPFMAQGRQHADWGTDCIHITLDDALRFHPEVKFVWVDITMERALELGEKNIKAWKAKGMDVPKHITPAVLANEYMGVEGDGAPDLLTVDEYRAREAGSSGA